MDNLQNHADLTDCAPCASLCGMCHLCVFAKTPPISVDPLWTVGDSFQRKFLMDLLHRCRSPAVLEKLRLVLDLASWSIFTYSPVSSEPRVGAKCREKPLGFDGHAIRDWFDRCPDWIRSHYLCRLLLRCDNDLLRTLANLIDVLLVRQTRGLLTYEGCNKNDEEPEEPAIMVLPGSSKSYSGISRFKDFMSSLPVYLAKRILGFLDEPCLEICSKVSLRWQFLANATAREIDFRRRFHPKILEVEESKENNIVSPTYASVAKVEVPVKGYPFDEEGVLKTEVIPMEERNVFCGAFFTIDVRDQCDPHRVVDYRGTKMMAVGSRDGVVELLDVSFDTKVTSVLKGNFIHIRALRLCEDKGLVITGSFDAIIRCWNLKSKTCVMTLSGHTRVVNCLDVCGDRLVSGSKDCAVKIWSLEEGKACDEYNFMHPGSVRCVRIHRSRVYSSCNKGHVKIWDLDRKEVLKVITAHQSSVCCLFFNEWHLLTGDTQGAVMAWSTHCEVKECIRTFNHPKEVKSVTLTYLRVITGCGDLNLRIFNFLTGDCLKVIPACIKTSRILSVCFHENGFVVNSSARVTCFHFGEVFWDNADLKKKNKKRVRTEEGLVSDKTKPPASAPGNKVSTRDGKTKRKSLPSLISATAKCSTQEQKGSEKVAVSEKATSVRIEKRGPHHPLTRDSMFLKMNTMKKALRLDEVGVNMELNAKLRDDWSVPKPPSDSTPAATNAAISKCAPKRQVSTAPGRIPRPHPPQSAKTQKPKVDKAATNSVSEEEPKKLLAKTILELDSFVASTTNVKRVAALNKRMEFKGQPSSQVDEHTKGQKDLKAKKKTKKGLLMKGFSPV